MYCNRSVKKSHLNLVLKFAYFKDMEDVDPFNISGLDRGKETEQGEVRVHVTALITYKTTFEVN